MNTATLRGEGVRFAEILKPSSIIYFYKVMVGGGIHIRASMSYRSVPVIIKAVKKEPTP